MNNTIQYLLSHNVKPSAQRIAIMKYLLEHRAHPTVDRIYTELLPAMPTLSRTTVYNTLRVLAENNALQSLIVDEKSVHYDGHVTPHAHFVCRECGEIFDMPLPDGVLADVPGMDTFKIEAVKLYYKGVCCKCQATINQAKKTN